MIDLYLDEMPVRLDLLREAVEAGDAEAVRAAAHKIKGSSANLGLPGVASASATPEDVGRRIIRVHYGKCERRAAA